MNAAVDYAAAQAMLSKSLPAYVSYTVRSHMKFDAIIRDKTSDVVVRTADGTIVKGQIPEAAPAAVHIGTNGDRGMEPVKHPAFKPSCYEATVARMQSYDGRPLEAISLRSLCATGKGDKDFDTLYVDPRTHEPVAATGSDSDEHVDVRLTQPFAAVQGHVLPSSLYVRIKGSGLMFWLDVLVDQRYENYRFSNVAP